MTRHSPGKKRKLSPEESRFYASIYDSAKRGSLAILRRSGCSEDEAEEFFSKGLDKVMYEVNPVARRFSAPQMVNFIKRAVFNVMLDERRRRGQWIEVALDKVEWLSDANAESPEEMAVVREEIAIRREAVQMLSERDRHIFWQRHQEELSPEEILQRTPGLSMRTYRKINQRANNRVMAAFEQIERGEWCLEMESRLLPRFAARRASESETHLVEIHISHCSSCREALRRLRAETDGH